MERNPGSPQPQLAQSPSSVPATPPPPPVPQRKLSGGLTRSPAPPKGQLPEAILGEDRLGHGRKPSKAKAREQKSQDEALNTGTQRPRAAVKSWKGYWQEQPMTLPAPLQPRLPPASASSPQNTHHPMQLGKWTHLWGATAPTPREQQNQRNPSLPGVSGPEQPGSQNRTGQRRGRLGVGTAQGPATWRSQETGHTLVTSPNLSISALCPEPSSTCTHYPPQQTASHQTERTEGGGGRGP